MTFPDRNQFRKREAERSELISSGGNMSLGKSLNRIEEYRFGQIRIGSKSYSSDVIIWPDRVQDGWWRRQGHSLSPEDLKEVILGHPARLVVGTGYYGDMSIPEGTRKWVEKEGIELTALPTEEAVKVWNRWLDHGTINDAVAAFHLTC